MAAIQDVFSCTLSTISTAAAVSPFSLSLSFCLSFCHTHARVITHINGLQV